MDFERKHGLSFLLSLAALPLIGCPAGDDETSNATTEGTGDPSTETSNTNPTTTASTSADTSATTTTVGMTTEPTTESSSSVTHGDTDETSSSGSGSSSDSGSSSSGASSVESESSGSGTTGVEVDPLCQAFAEKYAECYPKYAEYVDYFAAQCTYELGYYAGYSAACGMAFEELLTCIAATDCKELAGGSACIEEQEAVVTAGCPGGKESTTSVGTSVGEDGG